ncbi:MAG: DUF116 domain-containing protein, partial [Deltaproteobacteria bacterium]|nr:DUF116 domain-containing protein [Deltaproteobacteria bacterium]
MSWLTIILCLALALALLPLGLFLSGRMLSPGLTVALFRRVGAPLRAVLNRLRPGLDLDLLVKAGNRYFRRRFRETPFSERLLFLPFCLRPPHCSAGVDRDEGLVCHADCPDCRLGRLKILALKLGYRRVYVVPSSRIMRGHDLLASDEFISGKIKEHQPAAALGVTCAWHLEKRLLTRHKVSRRGYRGAGPASGTALQGVLLRAKNCRAASVDWDRLTAMVAACRGSHYGSGEAHLRTKA